MFLSKDDMEEYGTALRMNPPVRESEHGHYLWEGVMDGRVDFIADDHSPHEEELKMKGIWEAISGFVGVETLMQVMFSEGVLKRGMSINHFVKMCSENGLAPGIVTHKKGRCKLGLIAT